MIRITNKIKSAFILAPILLASFIVSIVFVTQCSDQMENSKRIDMLYVPLILASLDNWFVFILLVTAVLGILWPRKSHPAFAFGAAFWVVFPAVFSAFIAIEIGFSSERYKEQLRSFTISTLYQRKITNLILTALDGYYHNNFGCCGLNGYQDFCNNSTVLAKMDVAHETNLGMRVALNFIEFFHGKYKGDMSNADFAIPDGEDIPKSCCLEGKDCTKNVCNNNASPPDIRDKGCQSFILEPLNPCLSVIGMSYLFPWIAFIYSCLITWAHLRREQGYSFLKLKSLVKKRTSMSAEEFVPADLAGIKATADALVKSGKDQKTVQMDIPKDRQSVRESLQDDNSKSSKQTLSPIPSPPLGPPASTTTLKAGRRSSKI